MQRKCAVSVVYIIITKKAKLHEHHISLSLLVQPAPFSLAQWTAMESSSMTLAVILTGNHTPALEEQQASLADV